MEKNGNNRAGKRRTEKGGGGGEGGRGNYKKGRRGGISDTWGEKRRENTATITPRKHSPISSDRKQNHSNLVRINQVETSYRMKRMVHVEFHSLM